MFLPLKNDICPVLKEISVKNKYTIPRFKGTLISVLTEYSKDRQIIKKIIFNIMNFLDFFGN